MRTFILLVLSFTAARETTKKSYLNSTMSEIDTTKESYTVPVQIVTDDGYNTVKTDNVNETAKIYEGDSSGSTLSADIVELSRTTLNGQNTSDSDSIGTDLSRAAKTPVSNERTDTNTSVVPLETRKVSDEVASNVTGVIVETPKNVIEQTGNTLKDTTETPKVYKERIGNTTEVATKTPKLTNKRTNNSIEITTNSSKLSDERTGDTIEIPKVSNKIYKMKSFTKTVDTKESDKILIKNSRLKSNISIELRNKNNTNDGIPNILKSNKSLDVETQTSQFASLDINDSITTNDIKTKNTEKEELTYKNSEIIHKYLKTESLLSKDKILPLVSTENKNTNDTTKSEVVPRSDERIVLNKVNSESRSIDQKKESSVAENNKGTIKKGSVNERSNKSNDDSNEEEEKTKSGDNTKNYRNTVLPHRRMFNYGYPDVVLDTKMRSGDPHILEAMTDINSLPMNLDIDSFGEQIDDLVIDHDNKIIYTHLHQPRSRSGVPLRPVGSSVRSQASGSSNDYIPSEYDKNYGENLSGYRAKIEEYDMDNTQNAYSFSPPQKTRRSKFTTTTARPYPQIQTPNYGPIFVQLARASQNPTVIKRFDDHLGRYPDNMRFNNYGVPSNYNPFILFRRKRNTTEGKYRIVIIK